MRPIVRGFRANGWPQQREAARTESLRFIDPGDAKPFQRLDGVGGVVLHSPEDDEAVTGRRDAVAVEFEPTRKAELLDLAFDQPLGGLRQRLLRLADTHSGCPALGFAKLDQHLAEEMRFSRTAAAEHRLVPARRQQRLKDFRGGDFQRRHVRAARACVGSGIECPTPALNQLIVVR